MDTLFKFLFLAILVATEGIRLPHRKRNSAERKAGTMAYSQIDASEWVVMLTGWVGMLMLPLFFVFTDWLDFADYTLPDFPSGFSAGLGLVLGLASIGVLWAAHRDLAKNWSPTLEVSRGQSLVTHGIYARLRHPIYTSMLLYALSQALMLHNWLAAPGGLVTVALVILLRIPREETMMLEHFGEEYRRYSQQVGGILPKKLG